MTSNRRAFLAGLSVLVAGGITIFSLPVYIDQLFVWRLAAQPLLGQEWPVLGTFQTGIGRNGPLYIWLHTVLLFLGGQSEWSIPVLHLIFLAVAVALAARRLDGRQTLAAVAAAVNPFTILWFCMGAEFGGVLILAIFLALAFAHGLHLHLRGQVLIGALAAVSLGGYLMCAPWIAAILFYFAPRARRAIGIAVAMTVIGFLPVVWLNARSGLLFSSSAWQEIDLAARFYFLFRSLATTVDGSRWLLPLQVIVAALALMSPVLAWRTSRDRRLASALGLAVWFSFLGLLLKPNYIFGALSAGWFGLGSAAGLIMIARTPGRAGVLAVAVLAITGLVSTFAAAWGRHDQGFVEFPEHGFVFAESLQMDNRGQIRLPLMRTRQQVLAWAATAGPDAGALGPASYPFQQYRWMGLFDIEPRLGTGIPSATGYYLRWQDQAESLYCAGPGRDIGSVVACPTEMAGRIPDVVSGNVRTQQMGLADMLGPGFNLVSDGPGIVQCPERSRLAEYFVLDNPAAHWPPGMMPVSLDESGAAYRSSMYRIRLLDGGDAPIRISFSGAAFIVCWVPQGHM